MNTLNKPTFLLWLPIVVWAATFTYSSYLLFMVIDLPSAYYADQVMGNGLVVALFSNIVVFTLTLILVSVYPENRKEFLLRLALLLSNILVAFIYTSLIRHYNPNL